MPPVGASLRALWPRLFADAELRAAAYALEASLQEIIFIVGPLLVAVLAAAVSPVLALAVAAAAGGIGTTLIALAEPVRAWRPEERQCGFDPGRARLARRPSRSSASPSAWASASARTEVGVPRLCGGSRRAPSSAAFPLVALRGRQPRGRARRRGARHA